MTDRGILHRITDLVDEEHELMKQAEHGGLSEEEHAHLQELKVNLDQCWDLLRQRRARREFGEDPNDAKVRDAGTVERYQQ
jgi:hypothetical protein